MDRKMRVLVTGGSGFLGSYIVEQLARDGHEVVALVRRSSNLKFLSSLPNVTFAYGSVEDEAAVEAAVEGADAIIHSAGLVKARTPRVYGRRDNEWFAFFQTVSRRVLPFLGDGRNTLSIIYGADAASACIRALFADIPSGRCYFVEDGKIYIWRDMLAELERVLDRKALI